MPGSVPAVLTLYAANAACALGGVRDTRSSGLAHLPAADPPAAIGWPPVSGMVTVGRERGGDS